jgi:hypothetical protein
MIIPPPPPAAVRLLLLDGTDGNKKRANYIPFRGVYIHVPYTVTVTVTVTGTRVDYCTGDRPADYSSCVYPVCLSICLSLSSCT